MVAALAILLGLLAVGYAVWPMVRGRRAPEWESGPALGEGSANAQADAETLRAWSIGAGELEAGAGADGPTDSAGPG